MYSCHYLQLDLLKFAIFGCECAPTGITWFDPAGTLSHHPGACFLTEKYPELFYPLRIGFWEVVGDTAAQHVLWLAARKLLVK